MTEPVAPATKPGDSGTCGFCGTGDGYLGDQGDESTTYLHSTVATRDEETGEWTYETHPGARPDYLGDGKYGDKPGQTIIWCGHCVSGLKHLFERHDDHNLRAEFTALSLWQELDGLRWATWVSEGEVEEKAFKKVRDNPAIHLEKLRRERRVRLMQDELHRRAGFDLTTRGWRP
jgi:hypothetical protein